MKETPVSYNTIHEQLDQFFNEDLNASLHTFRNSFAGPLLDELTALRTDIFKLKRDPDSSQALIAERLESSLNVFKALLQRTEYTATDDLWIIALTEAIGKQPERIRCIQGEDRFKASESDGRLLRLRKAAKQQLFNTGKLFHRDESEPYEWIQEIPFQQLLRYGLLCRPDVFSHTISFEYSRMALALRALLYEVKEEIREEAETIAEKPEVKTLNETEPGSKSDLNPVNGKSDEIKPKNDPVKKNNKTADSHSSAYTNRLIDEATDYITLAIHEVKLFLESDYSSNPALKASPEILKELAEKVGTIEFGERKLSENKLEKQSRAAERNTRKNLRKWQSYLKSQLADLQVQIELSAFGIQLQQAQETLLKETHTFFRDTCYVPTENGVSILREVISELEQEEKEKQAVKKIETARSKLQDDFVDASLAMMQNEEQQERLITEIRQTISDLELEMNSFTETLQLAEKRTFAVPVPELTTDSFRWRSIASRFIKNEALNPIRPETQHFSAFILEQAGDIEEAAAIVDANLQAASSSDQKEGDDSPLQIALSGLKRSVLSLEKSIKSIREKQNAYETLIRSSLPVAFQRLSLLMLERRYDEFEMRDKALQAKETALGWQERFIRYYAVAEDNASLAWRYGRGKFFGLYNPAVRYLGFRVGSSGSARARLSLTEYLLQHKTTDEKLPFIYQRLFKRSFLIDKRYYLDAGTNLIQLSNGYGQWRKGIPWSMAIAGQKGSGKSTLLHFFKQDETIKDDVVHINLEQTIYDPAVMNRMISKAMGFAETPETADLIQKIQKSRKRRVLIFEGLQNLYIRNINGYSAIAEFWLLLSQTTGQLFWVVSCSGNAWSFFCKMFSADQFFSQIIRTDELTDDQIEKGIMLRHRATGYELTFKPSNEIQRNRSFRKILGKEKEIQNYLQKEYFGKLSQAARGNFSIAMIFWVNSISKVDDEGVIINPIELADIDTLETPSRDVLFALAALIRHDVLTARELAFAMHNERSEAQLLLGRLSSKGLVVETSRGFTINHLVYRQISQMLSSRNILH